MTHERLGPEQRRLIDYIRDNPGTCVAQICNALDIHGTQRRIAVYDRVKRLRRRGWLLTTQVGARNELRVNAIKLAIFEGRL